jgi:four helix bundle protein
MPTIRRFEDIEAWRTARELARQVYAVTEDGKLSEDFGLKDQLRKSSVAIMSNIVEGFENKTQDLFIYFLTIARASVCEVRSQLYVSRDVNYLTEEQFFELSHMAEKTTHQLSRLIFFLETHPESIRIREDAAEYVV